MCFELYQDIMKVQEKGLTILIFTLYYTLNIYHREHFDAVSFF